MSDSLIARNTRAYVSRFVRQIFWKWLWPSLTGWGHIRTITFTITYTRKPLTHIAIRLTQSLQVPINQCVSYYSGLPLKLYLTGHGRAKDIGQCPARLLSSPYCPKNPIL
ncbi:hypothetical protein GDO78_021638 [Eleutherodactylus coqui]|uniref:Uncharacterized protein n=1 Tax=Eleutherodactylus coqui TaxID=57060 RepID=A0A8J6EH85_ELECQ|nr:hypothetical protein GDO78_021638 [Eleutherodactylus coqui]